MRCITDCRLQTRGQRKGLRPLRDMSKIDLVVENNQLREKIRHLEEQVRGLNSPPSEVILKD